MKTTAMRRTAATLTLGTVAAMAVGCSSERNRLAEFRDDPTPDLVTMHERPDDIRNRITLIRDEQSRMLYRDWLYLWYLDRPTRLSPNPTAW
ncbi:MAG: hypothetical protein AAGF47_11835 [Planctomycetota bacterium]